VTPADAALLARLQQALHGEFVVERELTGGMSRVFVARDLQLQRAVVVKVLPPGLAATVSADRFRREIMLSASLQHPNIVPVFRAAEVDGLPFFVMPYVQGESLRTRLRRGPLSVPETVRVLTDVARALAFAHGRGIVHRDIKPDNILLAANAAVVADFGVAKAISASRERDADDVNATGVGVSLGTPQYMAPEQAVGDPTVDHRVDLYALGVVAYEMLVGVPPFHGRSARATLTAHLSEAPPQVGARRYDVPVLLEQTIESCLQKSPDQRPRNAGHLLRMLDDVATSIGGRPEGLARTRSRGRLRRAALAGGAGAVLILTVLAVSRSSPQPRSDSGEGAREALPGAVSALAAARPLIVHPIAAAGADARAAAIAQGLTSDLASALSQLPGYRVVPLSAGHDITAGELAAGALALEGTVQRDRAVVRVRLRLVDPTGRAILWTALRRGSEDSVLALQDELTGAAVLALATLRRP
jgi:serine/threonine-protein kinase